LSDADVIVIGGGAAGAAAALAVAERGATALVLEKQPKQHHTPGVRMSGGMVMVATDIELAAHYLDACSGGLVPQSVSHAWASSSFELLAWLKARGVDPRFHECGKAEHPGFPGAGAIAVYQPGSSLRLDPAGGAGRALYDALRQAVDSCSNITSKWQSAGDRLLMDGTSITGVVAGGREWHARYGVVLATGGFEMDIDLKRDFLPAEPTYFYGSPAATGDGIRMAMAAGADLWHMSLLVGRAIGNFKIATGREQGFILRLGPPGYVITDRYGKRFANEDEQAQLSHSFYYHLIQFDPRSGVFPRVPAYWIFDERRRKAGPLTIAHIGASAVGIYTWSEDNSAEIERGWIHRGSTVAEAVDLAGGEDPGQAERTVAEYNSACGPGTDAFGRATASLIPLDSPPFYCVPLWPGGSNTSGGPRRDARARVINTYGDPIPGLFAAGELGQPIGRVYPADGANLSEALCFGRIAAYSALDAA
jgi:succinate dehydrogenase/fumarate reductase flavoprotein subunit